MPPHNVTVAGESIEVRVARLEERLDAHDEWKKEVSDTLKSINSWLRGVMGSLILALVLLVANLLVSHKTEPVTHETVDAVHAPTK